MKYLTILLSVFIIAIGCTEDEHDSNNLEVTESSNYERLPQNIIPMSEAMGKIQAYQVSKTEELQANSAHIDLEELNRYLAFAETKMTEVNKEMSGLEVYFGRYLDVEEGHHLKGQLSLIYFPTYKDNNGNDIPFDFVSEKSIREVYTDYSEGKTLEGRTGGSSAWNRSNMSPPRMPSSI